MMVVGLTNSKHIQGEFGVTTGSACYMLPSPGASSA